MSDEIEEGTRAQIAALLRLTPAERLRSLVNTVELIQRARERMRVMSNNPPER